MFNMKKEIITVSVVAVLIFGYYLVSPLWKKVKLDEGLPNPTNASTTEIYDNFEKMTLDEKSHMEEEVLKMKDNIISKKEGMPEVGEYQVVKSGEMMERAHSVSGKAILLKFKDQYYLRLENLKTVNGPDLRVYLSAGLDNKDFVNLGPIRATEGSANYVIPLGTDVEKYKYVLIWCKPFGVLFSYSILEA